MEELFETERLELELLHKLTGIKESISNTPTIYNKNNRQRENRAQLDTFLETNLRDPRINQRIHLCIVTPRQVSCIILNSR